eukprot:TRINITY_DN26039_c0_g1_i1.p1 TRINITY_DN26039_c0_g1~~TRINITY_DN26039_c0_g1_i1.p1  ORF type:complete len:155 (+),score=1.35 TRINITY_DN26039_c0_g1_i1:19-483(+)
MCCVFFFQAEDGIRDLVRSRGLGDVYKRQLLGGYLPERIDPALSEMRAGDCISRYLNQPQGQHVICATVREEKGKLLGLEAGQLYAVVDAKLFQNSRLLRIYGFNAQWRGTFAFDSPTWTVEVEETLGFDPQKSRDRHALHTAGTTSGSCGRTL